MVDSGQNLCAGIWQDTLSVKNDFETLIIFEGIFLRYKIQMHYLKKNPDENFTFMNETCSYIFLSYQNDLFFQVNLLIGASEFW